MCSIYLSAETDGQMDTWIDGSMVYAEPIYSTLPPRGWGLAWDPAEAWAGITDVPRGMKSNQILGIAVA